MNTDDPYSGPERREERRHGLIRPAMDAAYRLLRWIDRHVRGFYAALGVYFVIGVVLLTGAVLLFAGMAELVEEGVTRRVDEAILLWLHEHGSERLDVMMLEITALGSTLVVIMTALVATAFLWLSGYHLSVVLLWVAIIGGQLLNSALKSNFDRPRPQLFEWVTPYAGHSSFPSGHAMIIMVVYATLAYLVTRLEPEAWMRRLTLLVAAIVILLVGISRLYLGVHYPSDVIGGFLMGFAWATFCAFGIEVVRYFRDRKPDVGRQERNLDQGMRPVREALQREGD